MKKAGLLILAIFAMSQFVFSQELEAEELCKQIKMKVEKAKRSTIYIFTTPKDQLVSFSKTIERKRKRINETISITIRLDGICPFRDKMIYLDLVGGEVVEPTWTGEKWTSSSNYGQDIEYTITFELSKEDVNLLKQHNIENIQSPNNLIYDIEVPNPELFKALLVCLDDLHFGFVQIIEPEFNS